jgi:hypothetical protein
MTYIPKGCDQQGRYPQAAESATEVGTDDDFAEDYTAMLTDISVAIVVIAVIGIIVLWVM